MNCGSSTAAPAWAPYSTVTAPTASSSSAATTSSTGASAYVAAQNIATGDSTRAAADLLANGVVQTVPDDGRRLDAADPAGDAKRVIGARQGGAIIDWALELGVTFRTAQTNSGAGEYDHTGRVTIDDRFVSSMSDEASTTVIIHEAVHGLADKSGLLKQLEKRKMPQGFTAIMNEVIAGTVQSQVAAELGVREGVGIAADGSLRSMMASFDELISDPNGYAKYYGLPSTAVSLADRAQLRFGFRDAVALVSQRINLDPALTSDIAVGGPQELAEMRERMAGASTFNAKSTIFQEYFTAAGSDQAARERLFTQFLADIDPVDAERTLTFLRGGTPAPVTTTPTPAPTTTSSAPTATIEAKRDAMLARMAAASDFATKNAIFHEYFDVAATQADQELLFTSFVQNIAPADAANVMAFLKGGAGEPAPVSSPEPTPAVAPLEATRATMLERMSTVADFSAKNAIFHEYFDAASKADGESLFTSFLEHIDPADAASVIRFLQAQAS